MTTLDSIDERNDMTHLDTQFLTIEEVVGLWDDIGGNAATVLTKIIESNNPPLMTFPHGTIRRPSTEPRHGAGQSEDAVRRSWALRFVAKCEAKPRLRRAWRRIDSKLGWYVRGLKQVPELAKAFLPSEEGLEFDAGWWRDLALWLDHDVVSAVQAAMLLSGYGPDTEQWVDGSENEHMTAKDHAGLKSLFEGASEQERSLREWAAYAREKGRKVHPWLSLFPVPWESMSPEEKKAAWKAMTKEQHQQKAHELLEKHGGNKTAAAKEVGISAQALRRYHQ